MSVSKLEAGTVVLAGSAIMCVGLKDLYKTRANVHLEPAGSVHTGQLIKCRLTGPDHQVKEAERCRLRGATFNKTSKHS
jgi:hypothetical protein